jgi:hypothetical protein
MILGLSGPPRAAAQSEFLIFMNIAGSQILLGVCIRRDTRHDAFKGTVNSRNSNTQYPQFAEMNPPWHPLESV